MSLKIMKVYFNDYDLKFIFMKCKGLMVSPHVVFFNGIKMFLKEEGMFKNITREDIENTPCAKVSPTNKKVLNFNLLPNYEKAISSKCKEKNIPFDFVVRYIFYMFYKENDNEYYQTKSTIFSNAHTLKRPSKGDEDPNDLPV